eukprot:Nitzschia sp. Nitz4//scaffold171_size48012//30315//30905//NITZ4_007128-RA/size48012-processed-gene-0.5-mRNA-1//1//CDS//3329538710//7633//frame0
MPMPPLQEDQLYQVSFQVENVGKTIEASKKLITWVFGIPDREYKVTLQWSKLSGKRLVLEDDKQVFYEEKKSSSFFHRWTSQDGKMRLHILATSCTPGKKYVSPNFLKYELIINGQRFLHLPQKDEEPAVSMSPSVDGQEEEHFEGPTSIFDVIYPYGYHEVSPKTEPAFNPKAYRTRQLNRRIMNEANRVAHLQA